MDPVCRRLVEFLNFWWERSGECRAKSGWLRPQSEARLNEEEEQVTNMSQLGFHWKGYRVVCCWLIIGLVGRNVKVFGVNLVGTFSKGSTPVPWCVLLRVNRRRLELLQLTFGTRTILCQIGFQRGLSRLFSLKLDVSQSKIFWPDWFVRFLKDWQCTAHGPNPTHHPVSSGPHRTWHGGGQRLKPPTQFAVDRKS